MKILITGADGQLGRCLQDKLQETDYEVIALNRKSLDITDSTAVEDVFSQHKPDVVINAAAYTAVDRAESEPELAFLVNETGPKNIANECNKHHIPMIHISTDYVFDGTKTTPYVESDKPNPQTVYGKSKLAGELAVKKYADRFCIIRTSWVFSEYGNNFLKTILRLAKERDSLSVVSDQYGNPTYAGDLAAAIITLVPHVMKSNFGSEILNYSGDPACSWFEFAKEIIRQSRSSGLLDKKISVNSILTLNYPTAAVRPMNSVMDTTLIEQKSGINSAEWANSISTVLEKIN